MACLGSDDLIFLMIVMHKGMHAVLIAGTADFLECKGARGFQKVLMQSLTSTQEESERVAVRPSAECPIRVPCCQHIRLAFSVKKWRVWCRPRR